MNLDQLRQIKRYDLSSVQTMFKVEPPEMLVDTILPKSSLTGLTGYAGTGKTWFALELSRAVATGTEFLKYFQARPGNVVFVGQDASIHDYAQQLRKLIKAEYIEMEEEISKGIRHSNPYDERLHFIIRPGLLLEDKNLMMRLAASVMFIQHSAYEEQEYDTGTDTTKLVTKQKEGTDLIVLDTLSSMTRANQNDNTEMEAAFRNLRWLAEVTGACVLLLHHNSKPTEYNEGEDWRGAGAQIAALDNWFHLHQTPRKEGHLLLKVKRFRGLKPEDFHLRREVDETSAKLYYSEEVEIPVTVAYDTKEAVLALLGATPHEFQTARQISEKLWPVASEFIGSDTTLYSKVCKVVKDPANVNLIEIGPARSGYRIKTMVEGTESGA